MSIADLRAALDHITAHPEQWDQTQWICGTKACLAGHMALRADWQYHEDAGDYYLVKDDQWRPVTEVACAIAGILPEEGNVLWSSGNSLADLEEHVRRLEADRAVYSLMSLSDAAWQHAWTRDGRVMVAAHRRTSYVRIGGCIERKDWDSRGEALEYAETAAIGRFLDSVHNGHQLLAA